MEIKVIKFKNDFQYASGIDYDYDSERNCDGGCESGDYCRCSKICDTRITHFDVTALKNHIVDSLKNEKDLSDIVKDSFTIYCIERLMVIHKMYDQENYEIEVSGGYYGEEIGGVTFSNFSQFHDDLSHLVYLKTNKGKMEFILMKEYGKILDKLKDVDWTIENVKLSEIEVPNEKYADKLANENFEYLLKPSTHGVVLNKDENTRIFSLIDGYHRYTKNKENQIDNEIQMVVARPKRKM
jgi:hypothetical protein